jgi:DNA helicase-2/ATP-dependent DNA helicase PcrA
MNSRAFPNASSAGETTAMPTSNEACAGAEAGVMADLTREQSLAAQTDGPVLVLAGAGTGKTRTLTAAVVRRILVSGIKPARILAVTFTNKAAAEMSSRIRAALNGITPPHWVGTFHGLGARQLRTEPEVAGLRPGFEILDSDDMRRFVRRTMKAMSLASDGEGPAGRDPVKVMCNRLSKFKDSLIAPEEAATRVEGMIAAAGRSGLRIDVPGLREAAQLYGEYQRRLRDGNAADFGDLLLWPTRAMQGSETYRRRWAEQFDCVLADEYQDVCYVGRKAQPCENVR